MNQVQKSKCQYCGLVVANETVLKTHLRTNQDCLKRRSYMNTLEPTYQCNLCLKLFTSQSALDIHTERNSCSYENNTEKGGVVIHSPKYSLKHDINLQIDKSKRRNTSNIIRVFLRDYENGVTSKKELEVLIDRLLNSSN